MRSGYALEALLGYTGIEQPMEYNSVGIGKPHIDSIGSEPGIEDLSEPALRVPDGDSLPGELVLSAESTLHHECCNRAAKASCSRWEQT